MNAAFGYKKRRPACPGAAFFKCLSWSEIIPLRHTQGRSMNILSHCRTVGVSQPCSIRNADNCLIDVDIHIFTWGPRKTTIPVLR